ncbi:putative N-acetylated-alpha-linked acidic dipeptidase [Ptychodera flava]|uniref:putative N-acetylated-alpha-linked acidic dipeptidase n=1 Tax=Ptychodera flava TaxID=63121 RepID=UPI003969F1DC
MSTNDDRGTAYSRWEAEPDTIDIGVDYHRPRETTRYPEWCAGKQGTALKIFLAILIFMVGIILGYLTRRHLVRISTDCDDLMFGYSQQNGDMLKRELKAKNLEEFLSYFSSASHPAGSINNSQRAQYISQKWQEYGFAVQSKSYNVLLSFPNREAQNKVAVMNDKRAEVISIVPKDGSAADVDQPFVAYSMCPTGSDPCIQENQPVYVNYGRKEDFEKLKTIVGDDDAAKDKIVILRYGKIHKGNMVKNAKDAGAIAVVLFPDSKDYASDGTEPEKVYPNTWWLPGNGTERSTVYLGNGDPLTPGLPSIAEAYRLKEENLKGTFPDIPAQTIGYEDAQKIFCGSNILKGPEAPDEWQGPEGCSYNVGPGFTDQTLTLQLVTHNKRDVTTITNVLAMVQGSVEPDRYVIIGNHRDSWTYGAIDAGSGTAILMELSRTLGKMLKQGWKPRRTIILASWDAKELGMIGSTEWTEEYEKLLGNRAVAYINLDAVVMGDYSLSASASPLLKRVIYESTKQVDCPHHEEMSVYENWNAKLNMKYGGETVPRVDILGSGTDTLPFIQTLGIPSMELTYTHDPARNIQMYPLYGTAYDDFYSVKQVTDPSFMMHLAMAQVIGISLLQLSDSLVLPFNVSHYAMAIQQYRDAFLDMEYFKDTPQSSDMVPIVERLKIAVANFSSAAEDFADRVTNTAMTNPLAVRAVNDQLMQLERSFIRNDIAVPGRYPQYKHVLFAPSSENAYEGVNLAGVVDSIMAAKASTDDENSWETVKRQLSLVTLSVQAATASLQDSIVLS